MIAFVSGDGLVKALGMLVLCQLTALVAGRGVHYAGKTNVIAIRQTLNA
jgi:hypothetical protein